MKIKVIIYIALISIFYSCNNKYKQLHKCIRNNEYFNLVSIKKNNTTTFNTYDICKSFEDDLLKRHLLDGIKKQDYKRFVLKINSISGLRKMRKILKDNLTNNEEEFITDFKLYQNLLICIHKNTNYRNKEIKNYLNIVDKMQTFDKKFNLLLIELIENFDDDFYRNNNNRCIILYQILYIYSNKNDFKDNEILFDT